jgi:hypothetical protein
MACIIKYVFSVYIYYSPYTRIYMNNHNYIGLLCMSTRSYIHHSFSHTTVVTFTAKVCAAIALILLNLFFLYFIILRGADKGKSWQWSYVMACIFQLLTDGLLYETLECYWVRECVVVPDLKWLFLDP